MQPCMLAGGGSTVANSSVLGVYDSGTLNVVRDHARTYPYHSLAMLRTASRYSAKTAHLPYMQEH